jgi:hypothetical protein
MSWLFKQKTMPEKKSSGKLKLTGKAEVDKTIGSGQEEGVRGRKNDIKKLEVIATEVKGVSRVNGRVIGKSSAKGLGLFMKHQVKNLQDYIDEYFYRFNRSNMKHVIFDNLLVRMVKADPLTYKAYRLKD